jgi:predicted MPP superfamily phosphohydrolase
MELWIFCFTVFTVVLNGACAVLQIGLLRRRRPWPRFLGVAVALWAMSMGGLFILEVYAPAEWKPFMRHWLYLPIATELVWNLIFLQFLVLGLIVVTLVLGRRRPVKNRMMTSPDDPSRRRFIYLLSCGAVPAVTLGAGVHGALSQYDLRVREFRIPIEGLPRELEGFTIAHVSDIHSGLFCGPKRLKIISDTANDLKADLVAVTGDVINDAMDELPAAIAAIRRIESRYGIYLCEGNHDVIPGPGLVVEACARENLPMLFNSCRIVPVHGRRLLLGGLPWRRHGFEKKPEMVDSLYPHRQEGDVRILLAHHPHLFDIAESADLVLAGHTHGGQIMFGPVGFGPLFFKYWSGPYSRGPLTMIVSNGCGDWFPCRIGAPAEVGLLRLTAAKAG